MQHEGKITINLAHGAKMVVPTNKLVPQSTQFSKSKVEAFRPMLRGGNQQPPLLVNPKGAGTFEIQDGSHRWRARILEQLEKTDVIVVGARNAGANK